MKLRFRKLYTDLIAADGTVCIVYIAQVQVGSVYRNRYGAVELYWPDGRCEIIRTSTPPHFPEFADGRPDLQIELEIPRGRFTLHYEAQHSSWKPGDPEPTSGLNWSVKIARAEARAQWVGSPHLPDLEGCGYADWVDLVQSPKRLGLSRLEWGRVHLPNTTLVFTYLRFRSGDEWQRAAVWSMADAFAEWDKYQLNWRDGVLHIEIPGYEMPFPASLELRPARTLHRGPAFDRRRFPNLLERMITRALAGATQETRWLSRVTAPADDCPQTGWALHESVNFG